MPLITGRRLGRASSRARRQMAPHRASASGSAWVSPARMDRRSPSSSSRTAARTAAVGSSSRRARIASCCISSSTLGIPRSISCRSMPSHSHIYMMIFFSVSAFAINVQIILKKSMNIFARSPPRRRGSGEGGGGSFPPIGPRNRKNDRRIRRRFPGPTGAWGSHPPGGLRHRRTARRRKQSMRLSSSSSEVWSLDGKKSQSYRTMFSAPLLLTLKGSLCPLLVVLPPRVAGKERLDGGWKIWYSQPVA